MLNRIAIAGCGNVGTALLEILYDKRDELEIKYNFRYEVTLIHDLMKGSIADQNGLDIGQVLKELRTNNSFANMEQAQGDFSALLELSKATMLAEATPTNMETGEPGLGHIMEALSRGISVTTTNKGPLAVAGEMLTAAANDRGAQFRYEGVVMSGTPLIHLLQQGIAGATVTEFEGILNGTTNFVLSRMDEGATYADAIDEAKRLGYAEANPTADVEGWDAAVKVAILARIIFGKNLPVAEVERRGITEITKEKIAEAGRRGNKIKPIAGIETTGGILRGYVAPKEIPLDHPLASVSGAVNAVRITTDNLGDITLIGPGAGRRETGQALLVDLIAMGTKE